MATTDLQTFIQDRLTSLIPGIDLSSGSPAQVKFIQPLLSYLGTDPFSTNISTFLQDRFSQEFPEIYPGDPGVINDILVKPLITFLEPFKREVQTVRRNQSLKNPSLLSDQDADALGANFFDDRTTGGYSRGVVRVYYTNPTSVRISTSARLFTATGLNFYPMSPIGILAEEMIFNRQGNLYYVDVAVQAENTGLEYNVDAQAIGGADGIFGYSSLTNPQPFSGGSARLDTATYVASMRQALNERSLVTRRGATARIMDVFKTSVAAVQQVGAGDEEMRRDLLTALSPGHAWITGLVSIYDNIALVQARTVDDVSKTPTVNKGDVLYVYLDKYRYSGQWEYLEQNSRFIRLKVEEVMYGPLEGAADFQLSYLVRFSGNIPSSVSLPSPAVLDGGLIKNLDVTVSGIPGPVPESTVESGKIHVYGRSDIYVKPIVQSSSSSIIDNLYDDYSRSSFKIQGVTLQTYGDSGFSGYRNIVKYVGGDFSVSGAQIGDHLIIHSGSDSGFYKIIKVDGMYAYLSSNLTKDDTGIRFTVSRTISVDLFNQRNVRIPFSDYLNNDLYTSVGSNLFRLANPSSNAIEYGAQIGDILRVKDGPDAGDYTITGFLPNGQEIYVDRAATSSRGGLTYEIFSVTGSIQSPLLRIKNIDILDTARQPTGVTIPPSEPVAVIPLSDMTSAKVRAVSQAPSGVVLPRLIGGPGVSPVPATGDDRYSSGLDPMNGGSYRVMQYPSGYQAEFLFPADVTTSLSYFMASSESDTLTENFPPVDPSPGDSLSIQTGPNKGNYLIKSVYKFKHVDSGKTYWTYFIKIHGEFPVDVIGSIVQFLDDLGISTSSLKPSANPGVLAYPGFFVNGYNSLGTKIDAAFGAANIISPGPAAIQSVVDQLSKVRYSWGDPARGTLRTYMQAPTLVEQNTAQSSSPTIFEYDNGGDSPLVYRPDLKRYESYVVIPARESSDPSPLSFPRDYSQVGSTATLSSGGGVNPLNAGARIGDTMSIYPAVARYGSSNLVEKITAVMTTVGSARIVAPVTASGPVFSPSSVGDFVFIDEGLDAGGYVVKEYIDPYTVSLDRTLSRTTPTIIAQGSGAGWGYDPPSVTGFDVIIDVTAPFNVLHEGKYLTLYGIDTKYQGSYLIDEYVSPTTLKLSRAGMSPTNFPAFDPAGAARWVITSSSVSPTKTESGTELVGLQPIRQYSDTPVVCTITDIDPNPLVRSLSLSVTRSSLGMEPYSISRNNIRRITSMEMEASREGPFVYFDTDVVSLGPDSAYNIKRGSYLTTREGTFTSLGYRHRVDNSFYTYSIRETGALEMTSSVLPTTAADSEDSLISIVGSPAQITYEASPVVSSVQDFASSPEDHVTSADILVRHLLPSYISYEATYLGGSSPSVVAKDIIQYIGTLSVASKVDVSELEKKITDRGGNPETPTKAYALTHDWSRKRLAEISENYVGGSSLAVPLDGTYRIITAVPGQDVSGLDTVPYSEIINLKKI